MGRQHVPRRRSQPVQPELARRDPQARLELLLKHAAQQFAEHGYEATSVNRVAAAAGVSVGLLYKHFADKAALLEAVLSSFEAEFVVELQRVRVLPLPAFLRLRLMVDGMFELASRREWSFWALTTNAHGVRGTQQHQPGAALRREIAAFIADGMAQQEFRCVDVERVAALGYGVVETALRHCFSPEEQDENRQAWATAVFDMLAANVAPATPPDQLAPTT
jgi:AcrR family transcriptional regulator